MWNSIFKMGKAISLKNTKFAKLGKIYERCNEL